MNVSVSVYINASKEDVWKVISDIPNSNKVISGIEEIKVIDLPESGLLGLKWQETRTLFGKTATEIMWITEVVENEYYNTRAESHGAIYESTISIHQNEGQTNLTMDFGGKPVKLGAKIMSALMGWMFKGATIKALQQDLNDIKTFVEQQNNH